MRQATRAGFLWLALGLLAIVVNAEQRPFSVEQPEGRLNPIKIDHLFNSKATSVKGENDGVGFRNGSTYPSEFLPTGLWKHDGVPFLLPEDWSALTVDNIAVEGQTLHLDSPKEVSAIHLLGAGQDPNGFLKSETAESLRIRLDNDKSVDGSFLVRNWWCIHNANKGAIRAPYNFKPDGSKNWNATHLFHIVVDIPPSAAGHQLESIAFPEYADWNNLHIFALTLDTVSSTKTWKEEDKIDVRAVRGTRRWKEVDGQRGQVVQVTITSPLSSSLHGQQDAWILKPLQVSIAAPGIKTLDGVRLNRFVPGDEQTLEIVITADGTTQRGEKHGNASVHFKGSASWKRDVLVEGSELGLDLDKWTGEVGDLEQHSTPGWYNGAKFGIFIHWGLFAVPAFGPPKQYAEWYNWWLHDDPVGGPTYQHHLDTYGKDFVYDDFIDGFTAEKFNASEWVDFFANAGARYFVLTTKHHDGYALFDTQETSHRNSLHLGPKRDFLRELMDAAEKEQPGLHRGTYFSMPEWFNPLYHKYGKQSFPGGLAHIPYDDSKEEPYTGYLDVDDYLADIQLEQMRILAHNYKTEIMWCDIGLANMTSSFASEWYASAAKDGKQVTMNDRCGVGGDFDTPEMTQYSHAERAKWESNVGMDPYSYGYNAATRAEDYRSAKNIIHTLSDIVAKGGNFLLNVGPNKHGQIIESMTKPLLEAGSWLKIHGAAIYDTEPFWLQAEYSASHTDVRFTRSTLENGVFYIISLLRPKSELQIEVPLPILEDDEMTLLSTHGSGSRGADPRSICFEWKDGKLVIDTGDIKEHTDSIAWIFEVRPKGFERSRSVSDSA